VRKKESSSNLKELTHALLSIADQRNPFVSFYFIFFAHALNSEKVVLAEKPEKAGRKHFSKEPECFCTSFANTSKDKLSATS